MKALLWKEWRESLPALEMGAALAIFFRVLSLIEFSGSNRSVSDIETSQDAYLFCTFGLLFPVFFLILGADRFSSEKTAGTLPYLLSLPVSKVRIWLAKLGVALGSGLVLMTFTLLINPFLVERFAALSESDFENDFVYFLRICVLLLLAGFNASVVLRRPLTAAVAGIAGLAVLIIFFVLTDYLVLRNLVALLAGNPIARYSSVAVLLTVLIGLLAATSLILFLRLKSENSRPRKTSFVIVTLTGTLFAMMLVQIGMNLRSLSMEESDIAHAGEVATVPGTDTVLFTIANKYGCTRVCRVSTSGGPVERLSERPLSCPSVSPDGRTIVCNPDSFAVPRSLSKRYLLEALFEILLERGTIWGAGEGYWPLRWGRRIMIIPIPNTNESSIEPVVTKTDGASINLMSVYWAPRGTRFVVNAYPGLILVTIAKEISMDWVPPGAPEAQLLLPLSWSEDGKRFLFVARRTVNGEWMDKLCEFDPETRRTSILFGSRSRVCSYCDSGKLVYVMKQDRPVYSRKLFVIELETKKERLLGENVESYYPKPFPRNNPWGLKGCTFLFTPSGKRGEPQELKVFLPESDSVKTLDRARFLAPCAFSPDERWAIYRRLEKPAPEEGTEFYSLYSANLATGKTHAIAKDGVNPNDRIAWPERTTLIFSKENKEIWSAAVDGSRLRRLYPEKTQ